MNIREALGSIRRRDKNIEFSKRARLGEKWDEYNHMASLRLLDVEEVYKSYGTPLLDMDYRYVQNHLAYKLAIGELSSGNLKDPEKKQSASMLNELKVAIFLAIMASDPLMMKLSTEEVVMYARQTDALAHEVVNFTQGVKELRGHEKEFVVATALPVNMIRQIRSGNLRRL